MFTIVKREEMSEGNVILNEIEAPLRFVLIDAGEPSSRRRIQRRSRPDSSSSWTSPVRRWP